VRGSSSEVLLARYADCIFWLARYVERAENLARILDVNETFSRNASARSAVPARMRAPFGR